MFFISMCFTLLTIIAAMHLWAKNHNQFPSSLFKWMLNLVMIVATLLLVCQLTRGVMRMTCKHGHEMMPCNERSGGMHRQGCDMDEGRMKSKDCNDDVEEDEASEHGDSSMHH